MLPVDILQGEFEEVGRCICSPIIKARPVKPDDEVALETGFGGWSKETIGAIRESGWYVKYPGQGGHFVSGEQFAADFVAALRTDSTPICPGQWGLYRLKEESDLSSQFFVVLKKDLVVGLEGGQRHVLEGQVMVTNPGSVDGFSFFPREEFDENFVITEEPCRRQWDKTSLVHEKVFP